MKFVVTLKDPDGFSEGVSEASKLGLSTLSHDECNVVAEMRYQKFMTAISRWVSHEEVIEIVFDTEEGTAVVRERAK